MMAKRGLELEPVHFFSYPNTSPEAKDKVLELAKILTAWCGRMTVHVVPFTEIQEQLRRSCPEELFTLIMRRFMMRMRRACQTPPGGAIIPGESRDRWPHRPSRHEMHRDVCPSRPAPCGDGQEDIVRIARISAP
jgi:thiamine biosynthesis protein ThiI